MSWSAKQYVAFEDERTRPARDLLAAIAATDARSIVDIGCGPGNSTELLLERFPDAVVRGLDSSIDMIEAARKRLPHVQFDTADIDTWSESAAFDVIFANAVLQWLPDHARLLPSLVARLSKGGSLAIQMPDNLNEPSHRLMRDVAAQGPWASKLAGAARLRTAMATASAYYSILRPHCARVDVWRTTYYHPLAGGASGVVEWFKGSGLRPFLDPLDEAQRAQYLKHYQAAIEQAYPALEEGAVLLPFPRLFIIATR
ncbi:MULTISPECIES: trans-aconitate 2-methyltransferase [unclassified Pseudomonas]|uniref:trans-aconitate 2-methyltransferase n=1 Tax=unclassified Pseudomonas TaxID=196821 RepID=UPI002AC9E69E|nr:MULTISPECIES: trans-aconitate 2-methyltransferase [unclassified Pseudomonas]MEB0048198.1 trans-aconitate 2-methyltransferase [Pseudomonas sp. Dout3]MEB0096621.1 trans-aconitate 2-methyltransferase [Pseudomonas sp. DC1.2]WPX60258.1 trans-aconitate 2-methyltransferase [Pseudomonas sp. DC1.2]